VKSNLSECLELTAALYVSLPKLTLTKLKYLKDLKKRKKKKQTKKLLSLKSSSFFKVQLKFKFVFRSLAETCSNKVTVVPAWNKWVVIVLEISFPHYRIRNMGVGRGRGARPPWIFIHSLIVLFFVFC